MRTLTEIEIVTLGFVNKMARQNKLYALANAVFARVLVEALKNRSGWQVELVTNWSNHYYDLFALDSQYNIDYCMPTPILKPQYVSTIENLCIKSGAVRGRKYSTTKGLILIVANTTIFTTEVLWNLFFEIVPPAEAVDLVSVLFNKEDADLVVAEIKDRREKLFAVRADWFKGLPIYCSITSVLAFNGYQAISQIVNNKAFAFVPRDAIWTAVPM